MPWAIAVDFPYPVGATTSVSFLFSRAELQIASTLRPRMQLIGIGDLTNLVMMRSFMCTGYDCLDTVTQLRRPLHDKSLADFDGKHETQPLETPAIIVAAYECGSCAPKRDIQGSDKPTAPKN
jgi:hypothetical protein